VPYCHIQYAFVIYATLFARRFKNNRADQKAFQGLGKFPNVLKLLKHLMAGDVQFENFPLDVWRFKSEALAWGSLEGNFFRQLLLF